MNQRAFELIAQAIVELEYVHNLLLSVSKQNVVMDSECAKIQGLIADLQNRVVHLD